VVVYVSLFEFGLTAANDQYSDEHEMSPEIYLSAPVLRGQLMKSMLNFRSRKYEQGLVVSRYALTDIFVV
jgi:hypothetical protein